MNNEADQYNISQYCIDIYHNGKKFFSYKKGFPIFKNPLKRKSLIINSKLIANLGLGMLCASGKATLEDPVSKYVQDFTSKEKLTDLINNYIQTTETRNEIRYFDIISRIVKKLTDNSLEEFTRNHIFEPMKMRSTSFISHDLSTTQDDYLKLCNTICYNDVYLSKNSNLQKTINIFCEFINDFQDSCFSYTDKNGFHTLIDTNRKIVALYNQAPANISNSQEVMFEKLKTLIYESFENELFSKGYNLFP